MSNYTINLEYVCRNQDFGPAQVVSSELVYPKGAVPNSLLIWIRIQLTSGDVRFVTLPLVDFYKYVQLPESKLGGLVDGYISSDIERHVAGYALDDSSSSQAAEGDVQHSSESPS